MYMTIKVQFIVQEIGQAAGLMLIQLILIGTKMKPICYSDAIDDWNTRKDLDKKLIDLTYQSQDALRATMNADQMTSSTLGMDMGIELQDLYGNKNDNGERDIETNSSETDFENT